GGGGGGAVGRGWGGGGRERGGPGRGRAGAGGDRAHGRNRLSRGAPGGARVSRLRQTALFGTRPARTPRAAGRSAPPPEVAEDERPQQASTDPCRPRPV